MAYKRMTYSKKSTAQNVCDRKNKKGKGYYVYKVKGGYRVGQKRK